MVATSPHTRQTCPGAGQQTHPLSELRPGSSAVIASVSAPRTDPDAAPRTDPDAAPSSAPRTASDTNPATPDPAQARLDRRLQDLGLRPGRLVQALRRAPLGDPVVFRVADYELCLRRRDVAHVQVTAVTATATSGEEPR